MTSVSEPGNVPREWIPFFIQSKRLTFVPHYSQAKHIAISIIENK